MGIITISRGSYNRGKEIAQKLSEKLGYECISREILLKASKDFNVPEVKIFSAIQDAPSVLDRLKHGKKNMLLLFAKHSSSIFKKIMLFIMVLQDIILLKDYQIF